MKMEKDSGICEGQYSKLNPLLIPNVIEKIVFVLRKSDLLQARRICCDWYTLATEEYKGRWRTSWPSGITANETTIGAFMDIMSPSPIIPVVSLHLSINILSFSTTSLLLLMNFIAPWVICLEIAFVHDGHLPLGDQGDRILDLERLASQLTLELPHLESLDFTNYTMLGARHRGSFMGLLFLLMEKIVKGTGEKLRRFGSGFRSLPLDERDDWVRILQFLPRGVKEVEFGSGDDGGYDLLLKSGLQLEKLTDQRSVPGEGVLDFLKLQKGSLKSLDFSKLEGQYCPTFPCLNFVKSLTTHVTSNSDFAFLQGFPNLVELTVTIVPLHGAAVVNVAQPHHHTFSSVRMLTMRIFDPNVTTEEMIRPALLSQLFPKVSHLSFSPAFAPMWGQLPVFLTHFPDILSLRLEIHQLDTSASQLESLISGLPPHVCEAMRAADTFDDSFLGNEEEGIGLANLNRLKILKIRTNASQYSHIFTKVTFARVFRRMGSFKEIWLDGENEIPDACLPFLQPLRVLGIDFFRTKVVGLKKRHADFYLY